MSRAGPRTGPWSKVIALSFAENCVCVCVCVFFKQLKVLFQSSTANSNRIFKKQRRSDNKPKH